MSPMTDTVIAPSPKTGAPVTDIKKISTLQSRAIVTTSGWMLFVQDRKLCRQPFDLRGLSLSGAPVIVAENIEPDLRVTGATRISESDDGAIVFSSPRDTRATIAWVDRRGRTIRSLTPADHFVNIALSPDERTIAVSRIDEETGRNSIWLVDAASGAMSPFGDDDSNADAPVWSDDGTRILYSSDRRGAYEVYERQVGNVSADRLILPSKSYAQDGAIWCVDPVAATSSGQMFYVGETPGGGAALWFWPKGGTSPRRLSGGGWGASDLSWDGKWLAQLGARGDNASFNIHVRSLEEPPRTAQLTGEGGGQPTWRPRDRCRTRCNGCSSVANGRFTSRSQDRGALRAPHEAAHTRSFDATSNRPAPRTWCRSRPKRRGKEPAS